MPTLLEIESSPLKAEASISRTLTAEYVRHWRKAHPDGEVITRDLSRTPLPVITDEWIFAVYTPAESRTPEQQQILALSDTLLAEVHAADEYVCGVPMHNFTVASSFRLWIDQIVRVGQTFAYVEGIPTGLLKNKKAQFMVASGGVYGPGTAMASWNFVEPYLRTVFGFIGVTETSFLVAGGASAIRSGKIDRPTFLAPHLRSVEALFQAA